jgi:CHRD domain-containing protein
MDATISRRTLILVAFLMGVAWMGLAQAESSSLKVPLTGAQCLPPVETSGTGTADLTYDPATRVVTWDVMYSGLSSPTTMAHFHGPATQGKNGPVVIWLNTQGSPPGNPITGQVTLTPEQAQQFAAGDWYVNVHTQSHPACELRGQVIPPKS